MSDNENISMLSTQSYRLRPITNKQRDVKEQILEKARQKERETQKRQRQSQNESEVQRTRLVEGRRCQKEVVEEVVKNCEVKE